MEEIKLNLYEKIQAVSNEIKNIEKGMTVGSGSYSYKAVSDLDVTLKVKEYETIHRLLSIPIKQEIISSETLKTLNGTKESIKFVDNVKMTIRIIDLDDISKFIDIESYGKGIDTGDKGFGKASTYARKYGLLNAYKIATGEDPDADKSKEIETKPTDTKRDAVVNYLMQNGKSKDNMLNHFNHVSTDDFTASEIGTIYTQLKKENRI